MRGNFHKSIQVNDELLSAVGKLTAEYGKIGGNSNGAAYGKSAYNTSGADYTEYFEWLDGNPGGGYFVTLDGDKIRIANRGDGYILGM